LSWRCDWKKGPRKVSSLFSCDALGSFTLGFGPHCHSMPSHCRSLSMPLVEAVVDLALSVSSILMINVPLCFCAKAQLNRAVLAPPIWRCPVGLGANRVTTLVGLFFVMVEIVEY